MKLFKKFSLFVIGLFAFQFAGAQEFISDSIIINGNCGMCKKTIEKSAKEAGATVAFWDRKAKLLKVEFDGLKTSNVNIQKAIAASGYDTEQFTASHEAYAKLEECCQYDRNALKKENQKRLIH